MSREMPIQLQVSAGVPRFINCQSVTLFLDLWLEAVLLSWVQIMKYYYVCYTFRNISVHISSEKLVSFFFF
jgi:hypothetical protein